MNRDEILGTVRAFIRSEIAHDPNLPLGPTEPLISGGILTSLDLVTLTVFLERRFEITVPDSLVSREHLDTLDEIAALVLARTGGTTEAPVPAPAADTSYRFLPSFRRASWLVLALVTALYFVIDQGVALALSHATVLDWLENRNDHRRMNYSYQGYERALARHELGLLPKAPDEIRIVGQGDSGTFGSYMEPDEACYGVADRLLREPFPQARLYNVSYFGQTFVKDASILEAALAYHPDIVIVPFCSAHLERAIQEDYWLKPPTTIVYNRALFRRFLGSVPGALDRPELQNLDAVLADSEARAGFAFIHAFEDVSAIARNHLLLQGCVRLPGSAAGLKVMQARRVCAGRTAADFPCLGFSLDERELVLLETIIERARAAGVELVLLAEPEPTVRGNPPRRVPWDDRGWKLIDSAVSELVKKTGVTFLDCRDLLPQDEFLDTERHWTVAGNATLGRAIADGIAPVVSRIGARRKTPR